MEAANNRSGAKSIVHSFSALFCYVALMLQRFIDLPIDRYITIAERHEKWE